MVDRTTKHDDIDDSVPARNVRFGFDGREMEIDLSEANLEQFRQCMSPYIEHGREVVVAPPPPPLRRGRSARPSPQGRQDLPAIRQWAREQGMTVADRGRISREIIEAYDQAQARGTTRESPAGTG